MEVTEDGKKVKQFIYYDGEDVSGTVSLNNLLKLTIFFSKLKNFNFLTKVHIKLKKPGTKIEHQGIRLEFIGQIELYYDRSNHHVFTSLSKLLNYPGEISENQSIDFNFPTVDKQYESYHGVNVKLR